MIGVKFTAQQFQLDVELKQIMICDTPQLFNTCIIKKESNTLKHDALHALPPITLENNNNNNND